MSDIPTIRPTGCDASWSITFARGSGQRLHQDMAVFHVQPRGFLIGCWTCEDIAPDSRPLTTLFRLVS
jgi:hypothetical protein